MRKLFKLMYQAGLRKRFEDVDGIRYLKRLEKGKNPVDEWYYSDKDAMQFSGGGSLVRTDFRGASVFFHCDRKFPLEWKIIQSGFFDRDVLELVADLAKPGSAIADIGGNVGGLAIPWAKALSEVEVHSFEPNPAALSRLHANLSINPASNLHVVEKALGSEPGQLTFHAFDGVYLADSSFVQPPKIDNPGNVIKVDVITLDDYFRNKDVQPGVLKLDVQGYEDQVLAGAFEILSTIRPYIVFEHEDHNFPDPKMAAKAKEHLEAIFAEHHYEVYYLTRFDRNLMFKVDWRRPLAGNLLALPVSA